MKMPNVMIVEFAHILASSSHTIFVNSPVNYLILCNYEKYIKYSTLITQQLIIKINLIYVIK